MILNIAPLSQRDPRWAGLKLGTVYGSTIGDYGCVITCMCMLSTYYNHPTVPNELNDRLVSLNLYYDGNLFVNSSISKIFPDIAFDKVVFCETNPAPVDQIKDYLNKGKPVVVALMLGTTRHYCLAVGYEGNQVIINDPWYGDQVNMTNRYGDSAVKILQVNFFSGPVPSVSAPAVSIPFSITDQTKINLGPEIGIMEVQAIRSEILDLRRIRGSLEQDLYRANDRIAQLEALQAQPPAEEAIPIETQPKSSYSSLKSRKFWLAIVGALVGFGNSILNWGLSQDQVIATISPLLAYIGIEGLADAVERAKSTRQT